MLERSNSSAVADVIVFDGVCNFCNAWVSFVLKRDAKRNFSFATAQSDFGRKLLLDAGYPADELETMLLVSGSRVLSKSDAAIGILSRLGGAWRLSSAFKAIPLSLRDSLYDLVARNRYRIAGRREICVVPTGRDKDRFLS